MDKLQAQLSKEWQSLLGEAINTDSFESLNLFVDKAYAESVVYPSKEKIFNAFSYMSPENVRVVILGQDPYHQPNQAHGLSFSVNKGIKIPPSLRNIFKEVHKEFEYEVDSTNGDLTRWSSQGVLLLNATLTVEYNKAGSHQKKGWELFTDSVIQRLSETQSGIVFILWGAYARKKASLIDTSKHLILEGVHPSPLAANRGGFFNGDYFLKANLYLQSPINWR